jgi:RimJ/RimL family protein N-acetyltransferase
VQRQANDPRDDEGAVVTPPIRRRQDADISLDTIDVRWSNGPTVTNALHLPDPPISLAGFRLRPWVMADVAALVAAWRDSEMHRWMPEEASPFEEEQARAFIDDAATHLSTGTSVTLAIADESTDEAVGSVTLHVWGVRHWNVGYWVAADRRRHGLATEAVTKLTRWAFAANPDLARLSLYTLPGNEPSQKVAERAGFRREGLLRRWGEVNGQQLDWVMFSLIREDLVA